MIAPCVTAVIPTFGRPQLLSIAVQSVLAQTLADIELIVVIDGDDPPTVACLEGIGDPRLRWIVHPAQRGAGHARDTGALAARGGWVAFLDDDDAWLPTKLERQWSMVPADGRAVLMTQSHVSTPEGDFIRPLVAYDSRQPIDEWLFDRTTWTRGGLNFIQTSSLMFPAAMFRELRFGDTHQHEDWELVIRAAKQLGYPLLTVAEPLVVHYAGQVRPSLSKSRTWRNSLAWADALGPLLTPRGYSGFLLLGAGQYSADIGEWSALPPLLRAAFRRGRPTAKQLFRFALCWAFPRHWRKRVRAALHRRASAASAA